MLFDHRSHVLIQTPHDLAKPLPLHNVPPDMQYADLSYPENQMKNLWWFLQSHWFKWRPWSQYLKLTCKGYCFKMIHNVLKWVKEIFTDHLRSTWEGNVFSCACLSEPLSFWWEGGPRPPPPVGDALVRKEPTPPKKKPRFKRGLYPLPSAKITIRVKEYFAWLLFTDDSASRLEHLR